uniref:Methylcrotonoyl-CoA carboxylase subunit alpha, mitochondrial n=1 Tax=Trichuris muris TaxID=70415 RepID=A0A5S6R6B0_TRIMR
MFSSRLLFMNNISVAQRSCKSTTQSKCIKKLLIANRGEIACRIIRTAQRLDIATVAVYSEADTNAMHVNLADNAYPIGPSPPSSSYLNQQCILNVALLCQADAIHPGYGFLSENAAFAEACVQNGFIFVGPSSSAMRAMGSKDKAKEIMSSAAVPVIDGYHGVDQSDVRLKAETERIGYPVMLKAVCSGGGKGMRVIVNESEFLDRLHSARSESKSAFGDDRMIIEKLVPCARHVEVQIFGDNYGNYVHLFERDCSAQRRCQKLIEEAPAPSISDTTRRSMRKAAIAAASCANYTGAGTVEFLVDKDQFYFLEMNTRLQVEHPVTEMITGIDLVEWQLRIASGERLPIQDQTSITSRGHSFEARIYAQNPLEGFAPCPGNLIYFDLSYLAKMSNLRLEVGYQQGDAVSSHYDPLIGKIVAWDADRTSALQKLHDALANLQLFGVGNNVAFLLTLCQHSRLSLEGAMHTKFIDEHVEQLLHNRKDEQWLKVAACWAHLGSYLAMRESMRHCCSDPFGISDGFRINTAPTGDRLTVRSGDTLVSTNIKESHTMFSFEVGKETYKMKCVRSTVDECAEGGKIAKMDIEYGSERIQVSSLFIACKARVYCSRFAGSFIDFNLAEPAWAESLSKVGAFSGEMNIAAPLPGIIERIVVTAGQQVKKGDVLLTMVAMKMEFSLTAPFDATVDRVLCQAGNSVPKGAKLVHLSSGEVGTH